jgi:hypothetical protein
LKVEISPDKLAKKPRQHYNLDMDCFMPFGKHRGTELRHLLANNPSYLCWLLRQEILDERDRAHQVHFSTPVMEALLDAILVRPELAEYRAIVPDEYVAEKRAIAEAHEAAQAERAAIYNGAGWGDF